MRGSRTSCAGSRGARVVTLDRNSSISYDAREHRFVNEGTAPQGASAKSAEKIDVKDAPAPERVGQGRAQAGAAANVRVPAPNVRAVAPPSRAMAPPPARASSGMRGSSGGRVWRRGGAPHGFAPSSATHTLPAN